MNAISEFFANAQATSKLKPKFYWTTSAVGLLVCLAGLGVVYLVSVVSEGVLNLDFDSSIRESENGTLWAWLFIAAIPISILIVMAPVAWVCGVVLVRIGYMKKEEVKYYALRSRYPAHWFKESTSDSLKT
jgi:hypothetical protein